MDNNPKLRYILEGVVNGAKNDSNYYLGVGTLSIEAAEREIKDLFLLILGFDEKRFTYNKFSETSARNKLKAELRQKVGEL